MHLNCWKFWNINQHFCFFNETYLHILIKKSVQKMLTLFKDLYNNCQWRLGQMVLMFLTEMSRVWNSFPLNSASQLPFNVSKKIFIIINKAKLIVQVKFYFPLKKPVNYDAGLRMTSIFLAYLRSCGKKIQVVNASPSSCTWGKLFLSYARALHCHHGQVKERSVLSSSSSFFFFFPFFLAF